MPSGCAAIQMQDSDRQTTRASSGSAASRHGPCHGCDTAPAWPTCDAVFALSSAAHAGTPSAHGDAARPGGLLRNRGVESLRVSPSLSESRCASDSILSESTPSPDPASQAPAHATRVTGQHPYHGPPPGSRAATRVTGRHLFLYGPGKPSGLGACFRDARKGPLQAREAATQQTRAEPTDTRRTGRAGQDSSGHGRRE